MFVSLQSLYIEILMPNIMILGGEPLGGTEVVRVEPTEWDYCLFQIPENSLATSTMREHGEKAQVMKQEMAAYQNTTRVAP